MISEISYNPPGTNGVDGEAFEFLELMNFGTSAVDLGGLFFTGITASFPYPTLLGPGQVLVLARDPVHFAERYPGIPIAGSFAGKLDNAGEAITLLDSFGAIVTTVHYNDQAPWPRRADGFGPSLQRVNTSTNASSASNWIALAPTPGAFISAELFDTDGDGLPDVWEQAHGFAVSDYRDSRLDTDGDGLDNLGEYRAGTDPRDASDCLKFSSIRIEKTPRFQEVVFTFTAIANHSYALYLQNGDAECWYASGTFPAHPTNRVETIRRVTYSFTGPLLYHLASPSDTPPPGCDGPAD
jgi:hypothetical protein